MKHLNMDKAVERYNNIMWDCGYECAELDSDRRCSDRCPQEGDPWTLRDMVAEADYLLSCYYECGNVRYEDRNEDRATYNSETGKLKRFIATYAPFVTDMKCTYGHCSKYDN